MGYGFGRQLRLRKTDEYSSVFAFRKAVRSPLFELRYCPGATPNPRLGLVVGKRFARLAVQRNLVKRLARERFRLMRADLPAYDLVLRVRAKVVDGCRRRLGQEIEFLFRRLPR